MYKKQHKITHNLYKYDVEKQQHLHELAIISVIIIIINNKLNRGMYTTSKCEVSSTIFYICTVTVCVINDVTLSKGAGHSRCDWQAFKTLYRRLLSTDISQQDILSCKIWGDTIEVNHFELNYNILYNYLVYKSVSNLMPNTHRRRRRDETVLSRRVGVGGMYMNSQLAHDDCRRIRSTVWKLAKQTP